MIKKIKKRIIALTMMAVMACGGSVFAYPDYGQAYSFEVKMPYTYQNTYFQTREKVSNVNYGSVKLKSLSSRCGGANIWFCKGGTTTRNSDIVHCSKLNTRYEITYTSDYRVGNTVRMGLEDWDNTTLTRHTIKGVVNYN